MTAHEALTVTVIGLTVFAIIDVIWQKLPDWLTAAFLGVTLATAGAAASGQQAIHAVLAAAAVSLIYLELGTYGIFGGGDVKLSVVPAFALGLINPLLSLWWLSMALSIQGVLSLINRAGRHPGGQREFALPHVPAMLAAFLIAATAAAAIR